MSNPYLRNRYGEALHEDYEIAASHVNQNDHQEEETEVDASVGFSKFPHATHLTMNVFRPTTTNTNATTKVEELKHPSPPLHRDDVVSSHSSNTPPSPVATPTRTPTLAAAPVPPPDLMPTAIDIEELIAATKAAMANAAALMRDDDAAVTPPLPPQHPVSSDALPTTAYIHQEKAVVVSSSTIEILTAPPSAMPPPAVDSEFRTPPSDGITHTKPLLTALSQNPHASPSRTVERNAFVSDSSVTQLAVSLLNRNDASALAAKIASRRPPSSVTVTQVAEVQVSLPSVKEPDHRRERSQPRKKAHHRDITQRGKQQNNNGDHVIPLSALESILETMRNIAPARTAASAKQQRPPLHEQHMTPAGQENTTAADVTVASLPLKQQQQSSRHSDPNNEVTAEVKLHPRVTFSNVTAASRSPFFDETPAPPAPPSADASALQPRDVVSSANLPAVGLSLLPEEKDRVPRRTASQSPSRTEHISRVMQPTQSWLHKGPEFQGIHLKNNNSSSAIVKKASSQQQSALLVSTEATKEERVSNFNRAASRALRIHSHLPPTKSK